MSGTDKSAWYHNYVPIYERLFRRLKHRPLNVLEVGVGTLDERYPSNMARMAKLEKWLEHSGGKPYRPGASLVAWKKFFKRGRIYGLDIDPKVLLRESRLRCFLCDSTRKDHVEATMKRIKVRFDIVIDDGSHSSIAQARTLKNLFPYVKRGGYYITEDVFNSRGKQWPERFLRRAREFLTTHGGARARLIRGVTGPLYPKNANLFIVRRTA